jgi:hypothetical protein
MAEDIIKQVWCKECGSMEKLIVNDEVVPAQDWKKYGQSCDIGCTCMMEKFEVDTTTDKLDLKGEEGKCPYCGSENVDFEGPDWQDGMCFYECHCPECENEYVEWYEVSFNCVYGFPLKTKGTE